MSAWLVAAAVLAVEYRGVPTQAGGPEVHLIGTKARTAFVLVSFDVPTREDTTLTSHALRTLLYSNLSWPSGWRANVDAVGASVGGVSSADSAHIWLLCPSDELSSLAPAFLRAVLKSRPVGAPVVEDTTGPWRPAIAPSEAEAILDFLRPKLFGEPLGGAVRWQASSVEEHALKYFVPANARIVVAGGGNLGAVASATRGLVGGAKAKHVIRPPAQNVRWSTWAPVDLHVVGTLFGGLSQRDAVTLVLYRELAADALIWALRDRGFAYAIDARLLVRPSMTTLLLLVPAFDESGAEVETLLSDLLRGLYGRVVTEPMLASARRRVGARLQLIAEQPEQLLAELRQGAVDPGWYSPDVLKLVGEFPLDEYQQRSDSMLVNDRRRFAFRFGPKEAIGPYDD